MKEVEQIPRDELLRIMDKDGFKAMCAAANDCPACLLSALRTRNTCNNGEYRVIGPDDGRNEWSYEQAKKTWWADWNSNQYDAARY